ncbi:hypothetical protein MUP51_05230 [Candidatus Bathyarchaeota archaeon]|nr:hypothetical protein [Candidatus Bathyarchaeota archaeon]
MRNIGALMALLLIASVAVSAVAVEPLFAKTKPHNNAATTPFNFQSTSGTANLTSNRKTSYPATLTLSGESRKNQQNKWLTKIDITGGTLTIDDGYYAAKVYEILAGSGIYNEKNSKVQITCKVHEVPSGSTYDLILHGKKTPNGFLFQAPESKLVGQYFLEISGQLQ